MFLLAASLNSILTDGVFASKYVPSSFSITNVPLKNIKIKSTHLLNLTNYLPKIT